MKKIACMLLLAATLLFACQKEDTKPTPEAPQTPTAFNFTETGDTIHLAIGEQWVWTIHYADGSGTVSICDTASIRTIGNGIEWGGIISGSAFISTPTACGGLTQNTFQVIAIEKNHIIRQGTPMGTVGWLYLKSPNFGNWGARTGTIGGIPAVVAPMYHWDSSNDTFELSHWLVGAWQ